MQTQTAAESLLDEASFMAALGNLEAGLTSPKRPAQSIVPPVATPVAVAKKSIDTSLDSFDWPAPVKASGMFVDDEEPAEPVMDGVGSPIVQGPSLLWRATAAAMFVLMMGVGAAGAAAVFHERVARIVAVWQQQ